MLAWNRHSKTIQPLAGERDLAVDVTSVDGQTLTGGEMATLLSSKRGSAFDLTSRIPSPEE